MTLSKKSWKLFYRNEGPNGIDAIVDTGEYKIMVSEVRDACLIAVAPDMLEMLRKVNNNSFDIDKLRRLISKAEGEI